MILVEFTCPVCRIFLTWATEKSVIRCPSCTRWVYAADSINPARMDTEDDQMSLF